MGAEPGPLDAKYKSENIKEKDSSGYSFEAVETNKSTLQMFKALTYLRAMMRFREPGLFFVQIIMPAIYVSIGVFLSNLSKPSVIKDSGVFLSTKLYKDDFYPYLYGFQNMRQVDPPFLTDLENFTEKPLVTIPSDTQFVDLVNSNLLTVLHEDADDNADSFVAYFNDTAQHSIPIMINALSNAYAMLYDIGK